MKVTDLRRKLMAALVAGGMLAPGVLHAADLDTNLVVNGDFENVDLSITSYYRAPLILDWGGAVQGFAYSHDGSIAGIPPDDGAVPNFANGEPLASGGHWYFSPGNNFVHSFDDALKQDIDVSAGPTASAIAAGAAAFNLSAFFNTYDGQADRGFVQIDFLGVGNSNLGSATISTPVSLALDAWTQFTTNGLVPVGTQAVRISSWGEVFEGSEGSADGYTDNIDFEIGLAGDYNKNQVVDAADYTTWRDNFGSDIALPNNGGLGTPIGQAHYDQWKANFGLGSGAGSSSSIFAAAVPEPSSVLLVGVGLASLVFGGRRSNCSRKMSAAVI